MKVMMLYGPPGTGKTRRLVDIVNDHNKRTLCVSFTRAAADELRQRMHADVECSTLHSLAYRDMQLNRDRIINPTRLREFGDMLNIPVTERQSFDDPLQPGDEYLSAISYAKHTGMSPGEAFEIKGYIGTAPEFELFRRAYCNWKRERGFVDFDDMITGASGNVGQFDLIVIDEAQDLSNLQWAYVGRILKNVRPEVVVVAGDDDQAIYEWSGANPHGMMMFAEKSGAESIILGQSWRIPSKVHTVAESVAGRIGNRVQKEYLPRGEKGKVRSVHSFHVSQLGEDYKRSTILYRNHALSRDITRALMWNAIPFNSVGAYPSPLQGWWGRAVRAYRRLLNGESITIQQMRQICQASNRTVEEIYGLVSKGTPWQSILMHTQYSPYFLRLEDKYGSIEEADSNAVTLSSIHQYKGKENDNIILLDGMSNRTSEGFAKDPDAEYRVFYVAVTRAKQCLTIIGSDNAIGIH